MRQHHSIHERSLLISLIWKKTWSPKKESLRGSSYFFLVYETTVCSFEVCTSSYLSLISSRAVRALLADVDPIPKEIIQDFGLLHLHEVRKSSRICFNYWYINAYLVLHITRMTINVTSDNVLDLLIDHLYCHQVLR
jgi:hypothetical protein